MCLRFARCPGDSQAPPPSEKGVPRRGGGRVSRLALAVLLAALGSPASAAPASRVVLCARGRPNAALAEAWGAQGLVVRAGLDPAPDESVAGVYCRSLASLSEADAARVAAFAESGTTLWLGIVPPGLNGDPPAPLRPWLPANLWSFKVGLDRGPSEVAAEGLAPLPIGHRFDLHLPGSPLESGVARYLPDEWLRDPARFPHTGIRARDAADGLLPLWLDASVGPARVHLLAFDPEDPLAVSNPAYPAWASALTSGSSLSPLPSSLSPLPSRLLDGKRFSLAIEESEDSLSELAPAPLPREGIDGITSHRYVYRIGTAPTLRLRLRNHFANIAPLATVGDAEWPENPSVSGLADNAFTTASVRGTLPLHAIWTGRNGTDSHHLSFRWPRPVFLAGVRLWGFGPHRHWDHANPRTIAFSLPADSEGAPHVPYETTTAFTAFPFAPERAIWEWRPHSSSVIRHSSFDVGISGLATDANIEPRRDWPSNVALAECEIFGWAGEPDTAPARTLSLRVIADDLSSGRATTNLLLAPTAVPFCSERVIDTTFPARDAFGPVRWRFQALEGARVVAEAPFDAIFLPADAPALAPRLDPGDASAGLLCSPGWRNIAPFGLGMNNWTQGWGGAHDKIWAWENDLLETGHRIGPVPIRDDPARLFGGALRASHYTNPWKRLPSGASAFRYSVDVLRDRLATGDWHRQGKTALYLGGSDRWNGIPVNACFTWDHFVRFDRWLRSEGRPGLRSRSRAAITREIREELGDLWQTFLLRDYADLQLAVQRDFADRGLGYVFETHGSFPLAGGELGADLARTHRGVGTDLFWDLQKQDLWGTLGRRVAVVASNPDLQSGAYDEWGWVNSEQNRWWFGSNSDIAPARRQWYATYFLGRVDLSGAFRPYHVSGFSSQGNHGPRYTAPDHAARCRVHDLVTHLRPEDPAGVGLVVSWRGQERRMGPRLGRAGFGLWPADGEDGVEEMCGAVFSALVKQGLPIAFVTSTHALKNWRGTNPLVLVDVPNWEDWEWDAALAARSRGTALIAVGAPHPTLANPRIQRDLAEAASSASPLLWSPVRAAAFNAPAARELVPRIAKALGHPLDLPPGIVATPFVAQGRLFLAVCRQGDDSGPVTIALRPETLAPSLASSPSRAVSLDDGCALPAKRLPDDRLAFRLPLDAADGKVVMLCP